MSSPALLAARDAVLDHPLLSRVMTRAEARTFMESHVFAVWDYTMLWKRVERELAELDSPWAPEREGSCEWLVRELNLEGDLTPAPHLDLYLEAMRELGADTGPIEQLLVRVEIGDDPFAALSCAPDAARRFSSHTLRLALDRRTPAVAIAAAYLWGREAIVDGVCARLVVSSQSPGTSLWRRYLARTVELDREQRGPQADRLLRALCTDPALVAIAEHAALDALSARRQLWDDILAELPPMPLYQSTSSSTTFFNDSRLFTVSTRSHDGA